ncbi:MAG TPA: helicase c2 [Sediminispirochaeta sp.]|nr:helicase c2 [Sediminispirochaeta sp.]
MKIERRLSPEAMNIVRNSIFEAEGQEVVIVGKRNPEGLIDQIEAVARGNDEAAPAVHEFIERGDVLIHNHPSGVLRPSQADLQVASRLGGQGIGFYIVDNQVEEIYCVIEPVSQHRLEKLSGQKLADLLSPGGVLHRLFSGYETREAQIEMLEAVTQAYNQNLIAVVEAGTGVGKSLAYLIPSADWALKNGERVIISTATINLQQQLMDKDIPLVEKILGKRLNAKLVKGRGNYLCLRRLEDTVQEMALFSEGEGELEALRSWAGETKTGSRDDLSFYPSAELWSRVCSEADACMGLRCPYREECFVLKVRKEAASSKLLVVNHHLLFSDLAARLDGAGFDATAVLPPSRRIVFDEAHSIERSATSFFSRRYGKLILYKQLRRLHAHRGRRSYGLAVQIQKFSSRPEVFQKIPSLIQQVQRAAEKLDELTLNYLGETNTFWIRSANLKQEFSTIIESMVSLRTDLAGLLTSLESSLSTIEEKHEEDSEVFEASTVMERLSTIYSTLGDMLHYEEQEDFICWVEKSFSGNREASAFFIKTPLKIAPLMKEAVFDPIKTVINTSATLTVRKRFDYWFRRVGLGDDFGHRTLSLQLESPFAYRDRVLLAIPSDAPEPKEPGYQDFVSDFVLRSIELAEGGALVLFTSYRQLQETYDYVAPALERRGIAVLKQGAENRTKLLGRFHGDLSSVLMATNSFWEGVDAPGESLKMVIICRLPFSVPTDPVTQARMEAVEREGGNSFMHYSLPEAAMKLRQGFGRLMRRKSDRGVVLILDSRIVRKSYGKVLLSSLPSTKRAVSGGEEVLREMEDFYYP